MNSKSVLEHIATLRREIEAIETMNLEFWGRSHPSVTEKALSRARQARLTEIHSELEIMRDQLG